MSSLENVYIRVRCPFLKIGLFAVLLLSCTSSLYILDINALSDTFSVPYSRIPHLRIQPTSNQKYLGKKIPESSKKQNLNLPQVSSYLHSIYIVLDIVSHLEMI